MWRTQNHFCFKAANTESLLFQCGEHRITFVSVWQKHNHFQTRQHQQLIQDILYFSSNIVCLSVRCFEKKERKKKRMLRKLAQVLCRLFKINVLFNPLCVWIYNHLCLSVTSIEPPLFECGEHRPTCLGVANIEPPLFACGAHRTINHL